MSTGSTFSLMLYKAPSYVWRQQCVITIITLPSELTGQQDYNC